MAAKKLDPAEVCRVAAQGLFQVDRISLSIRASNWPTATWWPTI
jgi:hypothetical protein